jgi:hypothetical protein
MIYSWESLQDTVPSFDELSAVSPHKSTRIIKGKSISQSFTIPWGWELGLSPQEKKEAHYWICPPQKIERLPTTTTVSKWWFQWPRVSFCISPCCFDQYKPDDFAESSGQGKYEGGEREHRICTAKTFCSTVVRRRACEIIEREPELEPEPERARSVAVRTAPPWACPVIPNRAGQV